MMTDDADDILAGLDFEIDEPAMVTMADLTDAERKDLAGVILSGRTFSLPDMSKPDLAALLSDVRQALLKMDEMHRKPEDRTEDAKVLHSTFLAIMVAIGNRNRGTR